MSLAYTMLIVRISYAMFVARMSYAMFVARKSYTMLIVLMLPLQPSNAREQLG